MTTGGLLLYLYRIFLHVALNAAGLLLLARSLALGDLHLSPSMPVLALLPSLFVMFPSAPASRSICAISSYESALAMCSAVVPVPFCAFTLHPSEISRCTSSLCPFCAAMWMGWLPFLVSRMSQFALERMPDASGLFQRLDEGGRKAHAGG